MDMFSTAVLVVFILACLAIHRVQQWGKKASENPEVREKAKEIGLSMLSRFLKK